MINEYTKINWFKHILRINFRMITLLLKTTLIRNLYKHLQIKREIKETERELLISCNNCTPKMLSFYENQITILEVEIDSIEDLIYDIECFYQM